MRGRFSRIAFAFWAALAAEALGQQQGAAPPTPAQLAERLVQLKSGRELPYRLVANWPTLPKGYNLGEGTGVDVDRQGNVWVANRGAWPIVEFDKAGKMLQAWNHDTVRVTPGVGLGTHGLKVDPEGNVWLVDVDGHIVFKYSPEGRLLMTLGNRQGTAGNNDSPTSFNRPTNLWFLPNGHFYVSDGYLNSRVVEFTRDGEYVRHWGTKGTGDGEFNLVHDVTVDSRGLVYVADRSNSRVQVFDSSGKFVAKWTDIGQPWGLYYFAREDAIYMCDGLYNRIVKLDTKGNVLGVLGSYGKASGRLDFAHSIAVDAEGSIYVAEIKNWRVQKWARAATTSSR